LQRVAPTPRQKFDLASRLLREGGKKETTHLSAWQENVGFSEFAGTNKSGPSGA
jgi:hypothetical protein